MALTSQQDIWIQQVRTLTDTLAKAERQLVDSHGVYTARDFAAVVGADPEALQEIQDKYDLAPADLTSMMDFVIAFQTLLDNGVPTQGEWRDTINKVRELS